MFVLKESVLLMPNPSDERITVNGVSSWATLEEAKEAMKSMTSIAPEGESRAIEIYEVDDE